MKRRVASLESVRRMLLELAILCSCFTVILGISTYLKNRKTLRVPRIRRRWPIIGNSLQLTMEKCHLAFSEWTKTYGPIYEVKLFSEVFIVLNDYHCIHQALLQAGNVFAGRPQMYRTDQKRRNEKSIVWQTYNQKLVFLRKEVLKSLKMYGCGLQVLENHCTPELRALIHRIKCFDGVPFNPREPIFDSVTNVMLVFLLGCRFEYGGPEIEKLKTISSLFNETFGAGEGQRLDMIPLLRIFRNKEADRLNTALKLRDQFWDIVSKNEKFSEYSVIGHLQRLGESSKDIDEDTVKECFTNLILAGTDTTATALSCLLLLMLHKPEMQTRIQREIDDVVKYGELPTLSDRQFTPYTEAVILELLRYISHVPLAVPHCTMDDYEISGYKIDQNSTIYMNLWAMHHDSNIWPKPWEFNPSRFLDEHGNLHPPQHPNRKRLLAFGAGRRVCLGETLAKNRLYLFVVVLLKNFTFVPEDEKNLPEVDPRSYELGLVLHPKPYSLKAITRD